MVRAAGAQVITVSEEVSIKTDYSYTIIGKIGDRVLLFRDQSNKFEVQAFDENMRLSWTRELDFERNRPEIIGINKTEGEFHLIYGYRDKGDYFIRHHSYDGKANLLDTMTIAVLEKQYFSPRFRFTESEDHTKVLIFKADRETELDVYSYDVTKREVVWGKQVQIRNAYLRRDFRKMIVSNQGDMIMLLQHEKVFSADVNFEVIKVDAGFQSVSQKEFNLGDHFINDFYPTYDNLNDQIAMSGLYNEKNTSRAQGIYYAIMPLDERSPEVFWLDFDDTILQDVYGKDVANDKGLTNFNIRDIALRRDGGALVIAEMSKEYSRRTSLPLRRDYSSYSRGAWVDYYYEDMIVYSIHPTGEKHWNVVLHKKQHSQDDDAVYSSYFLFKTPQKLRLLYNDEIRNENTVSEYILRGNGYFERKSVFSTDYHRLKLRFKDAVQVAYNECIVPSERNNRLNLVRIMF